MTAFGVWDQERKLARRSYILIDKEGVVRYKNIRPSGKEADLLPNATETLLNEVKKINKGS